MSWDPHSCCQISGTSYTYGDRAVHYVDPNAVIIYAGQNQVTCSYFVILNLLVIFGVQKDEPVALNYGWNIILKRSNHAFYIH